MAKQYDSVKDVARRRGLDPKALGETESKVMDMDELAKSELVVMSAVSSHPLMEPMRLTERYHELDETSKDSLWMHVYRLNTHAQATQEDVAASGVDMAASATEEYMSSLPPQWRERFMRASSEFGGTVPSSMEGWQKGLGVVFEGATGDDMLSLFNAATSQFSSTGGMAGMQSMLSAAASQAGPEGGKLVETMGDMGKVMSGLMSTMGGAGAGAGAGAGGPSSSSSATESEPMMTPAHKA